MHNTVKAKYIIKILGGFSLFYLLFGEKVCYNLIYEVTPLKTPWICYFRDPLPICAFLQHILEVAKSSWRCLKHLKINVQMFPVVAKSVMLRFWRIIQCFFNSDRFRNAIYTEISANHRYCNSFPIPRQEFHVIKINANVLALINAILYAILFLVKDVIKMNANAINAS